MPRRSLPITHEFPYHIVARSNNKEWFYLPIDVCWSIFAHFLTRVSLRFSFQIHAFVLMSNHYHLIGPASEEYPLPKVMEWLQRSLNRMINDKAGRINHVFGGPYKASLISSEIYYLHALKYVYRNPVNARLVLNIEDYKYSSLAGNELPLINPITGIESLVPKDRDDLLRYFSEEYKAHAYSEICKGLAKKEFKISSRIDKATKKEIFLR